MLAAALRRLNDIPLREKLLASFVVFLVAPLLLLSGLALVQFRQSTLDQALSQAEQGVGQLRAVTTQIVGVGQKTLARLAADDHLETLLTHRYASTLEVYQAYHDLDTFRLYRDTSPDLAALQAWADNATLIDNWEIRPLGGEDRASTWYRALQAHPFAVQAFSRTLPHLPPSVRLVLARSVSYGAEGVAAALVVGLDLSRADQVLPREGFETYVLAPDGVVVAASRPDVVGRPCPEALEKALGEHPADGRWPLGPAGGSDWLFVRHLALEGSSGVLRVVGLVRTPVILGPADRVATVAAVVLAVGTVASLAVLWVVSSVFSRRLARLSRELPRMAEGHLDPEIVVEGRDEIGQLASSFQRMVVSLKALVREVDATRESAHQLELAQGEMRLKMLSSQIQPHFLFNVLESIRMKAHLRGEREIASTVKLLGKLMRRNLEASGAPMPLGEELENVRCYLEIEKFRLEEKLEYQLIAQPGAESVLVPPLIVEPLVENAVIHGLERRFGGGRVTVTATLQGQQLTVEVEDDGLGMTPQQVDRLWSSAESQRVGLSNIHQRLQLTYGPSSGLHVSSEAGKGTRVWFAVPVGGLSGRVV